MQQGMMERTGDTEDPQKTHGKPELANNHVSVCEKEGPSQPSLELTVALGAEPGLLANSVILDTSRQLM